MEQPRAGRWALWLLGWLPVLVLWANNPKLTNEWLSAFSTTTALSGVGVILVLLLAFKYCYLRPGCCECLCKWRRAQHAGSRHADSNAVSRRLVRGAQPSLWNPDMWDRWTVLFLAFSSAALAVAVSTIIAAARACIESFTSTETSKDSVRGASQPMGAGLSAILLVASVTALVVICMRLLAFWKFANMSPFRIYVEHVLAAKASASEDGGAWLAEARRVEQQSRELVYIQQRAEGLGHQPSPWLVNQIVHKTMCVLRPLFDHHVRRKGTAGEWADPAGPGMKQFASNLWKAVDAEQRSTRATRPPSPLLSGLPDVLSRLLSTRSGQLPSLNEVQDLGTSLRVLDLLEMADGHQHPPRHQHGIVPQTAWDAALLMQLYWLCCTIPEDDNSLVRLHLLGNVFFMLRNWKAAPEAGEHQLRTENSAAYRICDMLWQSKLHAEHHNGVKQAARLIDPSDEEAKVEQLDTIMAFLMRADESIECLVVDTSTSQPHNQRLDEQASHSAGAGAGAGTGANAGVGAGGPRASD